jgi:hypothetical protein
MSRFTIKVNEQGVIWMAENTEASAWLQARGGNKDPSQNYDAATATTGTNNLLAELASWVVF